MAHAILFPTPAKLRRKGAGSFLGKEQFSEALLSQARTVLDYSEPLALEVRAAYRYSPTGRFKMASIYSSTRKASSRASGGMAASSSTESGDSVLAPLAAMIVVDASDPPRGLGCRICGGVVSSALVFFDVRLIRRRICGNAIDEVFPIHVFLPRGPPWGQSISAERAFGQGPGAGVAAVLRARPPWDRQ
jgi:hypothetical protein